MNKKNSIFRFKHLQEIIQSLSLIILIVMVIFMIIDIRQIQGTGRIINYAGIVRGATQRLIKLEITNNPQLELEDKLDRILVELKNGGDEFQLVHLNDENYQQKLETLSQYWIQIRKELTVVRNEGYEASKIVEMSETYFDLADQTVSAAESYSQKKADEIQIIENISIAMIIITVAFIVKQSFHILKTNQMNKRLEKQAYIDDHTQLPNKNQCEHILKNYHLTNQTICIMIDLNNLKTINDTLGHIEGDKIIGDFACILKDVIANKGFIGRYGGDEFIAIIENNDVHEVISSLKTNVDLYNQNHQSHISFAYGYALSSDYPQYSLKALLDKADQYMYINKNEYKSRTKKRS